MSDLSGTKARAGWVYLVGAGPGDPALLTLRGAELLSSADVVLHDELVDPALLELADADADCRSVGKRGDRPESRQQAQDAILNELVAQASAGRSVVRLKGGDPCLFGRGVEEAEGLRREGIPFEVVPGITSVLGAPAYAGIPLSHRGLASAVTIVTAAKRDGEPFDWSTLHGRGETLCVLMGTRRLPQICRGLIIDAGYGPETPAAVVQWLSLPRQRTVVGTLGDIAERVAEAGIGPPTVLLVGEVVGLRSTLSWFDTQPLFGSKVLVTRPAHQAAPTMNMLRRRGAEALPFPTIAIEPPLDPALVRRAVEQLDSYDLVAFTSPNGVSWFWREIDRQELDARAFGRAKVAAIGPATAAELRNRGLRPDLIAETFVAEELARAIVTQQADSGGRVLLPRALVAREILPEMLREAGMQVDVVPVYRTVSASTERRQELIELLESVDLIMLTSSSTVDNLCALLGDGAVSKLADCKLASIGPITTQTAEALGLKVWVTAEVSTSAGLVEAMEERMREERG